MELCFLRMGLDGKANLYKYGLNTDSTVKISVTGVDMYPQVSPDGKSLLFISSAKGNRDVAFLLVP